LGLLDDLEKVITYVIKKIAEIIENEFYYRLGYCQDAQGQHFEHLLYEL
jgi:hypothetical protein